MEKLSKKFKYTTDSEKLCERMRLLALTTRSVYTIFTI